MKKLMNYILNLFRITKKSLIHKHEWREFGESNSPIEDKVFTCKTCGKMGFPRYEGDQLIIEVWN